MRSSTTQRASKTPRPVVIRFILTPPAPSTTGSGYQALLNNTTASENTANGFQALYANTVGFDNTASGLKALYSNTTGNFNAGNGAYALYSNTTGIQNTANGYAALYSNTTGGFQRRAGFFRPAKISLRAVPTLTLATLVLQVSPEPSASAQPELRGKPLSPALAEQRLQVA